jgi:CBS domain-containing protein
MRIREAMSQPAVTCREDMKLDAVVRLMAEFDCGLVPVVNLEGRLSGVVTDRDICLGALNRKLTLDAIPVGEVMARQVFSCRGEELIESAERLMRDQHIHRVPVIDADRRPIGVLSIDDLARVADRARHSGVDREFVHTFAEICRLDHRTVAVVR